jgi:hypothetical protein
MEGRLSEGTEEGAQEEEEDDAQEEEEEEGRYLARFVERELLDASVYGIQPERVIHHSGAALLTTMHALLAHAAAAAAAVASSAQDGGGGGDGGRDVCAALEAARAEEARALYTALARKCASLLGSVWLEARCVMMHSWLSQGENVYPAILIHRLTTYIRTQRQGRRRQPRAGPGLRMVPPQRHACAGRLRPAAGALAGGR